jgi:hypothetical protein
MTPVSTTQHGGYRRSGDEGGCVACQKPVSDHLDKHGAWLGCPRGDAHTTFILVPVRTLRSRGPVMEPEPAHPLRRVTDAKPNGHEAQASGVPIRTIRSTKPVLKSRYRYKVADRRLRPELSPTRTKVYETLLAHPEGLVSRQLMTKARLVHGSVQQTLNWLREHKLVDAIEVE